MGCRTVTESSDDATRGISDKSLSNTQARAIDLGLIHDDTEEVDLELEVVLIGAGLKLVHGDNWRRNNMKDEC